MAHKAQSALPISAPTSLLTPIKVPQRLLMGPGPSNASPRVLAASALPLLGHLHKEFLDVMDEIKEGLRYIFQTNNSLTIAISGTGHAAMEAAIANVVERNDKVLVAVNGLWGARVFDLSSRYGAKVTTIKKPVGQVFTLEEIEEGLIRDKPKLFFITHAESSATVLQPLEGIGRLCHKHNCLLLVDTVASLGGIPIKVDELEIDIVYSGAQKCLSSPPGASPISFSPRAWDKVKNRKTKVESFYFDLIQLANYWGVDDQPRRYHHTGPISSFYALREGISILCNEGLENSWRRHKENSELLWNELQKLGLELYVKKKIARLPTVTAVNVPNGINWKEVATFIMQKYNLEISGGLGETAGKVWRIGLMGYNCTKENVQLITAAMYDALQQQRQGSVKSSL
ncbi:uncharacterized protein TRIADDRAFT_26208 [Trichoplax adhaerens]|uniref:Alanine--glyoxylate aminotransferase n=1 Tax=Trichoplax adhaerens TaxID=10228 RepID=B3RZH7_TRIAD|nr:hypothetical protein TRIADDRAFT_26208 [Trichoplax adhaerens]EDV24208.1 hypothetical protein TRIADDRAFT_26208 [Trichoplax adhaerens]|eukprot:XP_002113734.1 hypothetical protein TRIADDRAFT_26208 [Trichoplax adhaerens]